MGAEAARLLLAEIENPRLPKREIKLRPELVLRGSTARPRASAARTR
jgi:DNA-binding LacI/PurR family transcriptional regulator